MYFLIEDDDLLEKYNNIWNKVSADMKKNFIASLFIIKKILKIKKKGDEVTDIYNKQF